MDYHSLKANAYEYICHHLKESRLKHTDNVAAEAVKLADRYDVCREKAELAALLHDCAKCLSIEEMNAYVEKLKLPASYANNSNLSHAKIGEHIARNMGITDVDILNAIAFHTTGRAGMSMLEKIIFIADAIEPRRSYQDVDEIRRLAYEDIDRACAASLNKTIDFVRSKEEYLDEDTVSALEDLKVKMKEKK